MALRDDANIEFLDNGPPEARTPPQARVDADQLRAAKQRIRAVGRQTIRDAANAMFADRWNKTKQRTYAKIARQLGVSVYGLDKLFGFNGGSLHAPRLTVSIPSWEPEFTPRVLRAAWDGAEASIDGGGGGGPASKASRKGNNQLSLPGTEASNTPGIPAPQLEAALESPAEYAGPLEVIIRQQARGEMRFTVRSVAEIPKLGKVLEGLL